MYMVIVMPPAYQAELFLALLSLNLGQNFPLLCEMISISSKSLDITAKVILTADTFVEVSDPYRDYPLFTTCTKDIDF